MERKLSQSTMELDNNNPLCKTSNTNNNDSNHRVISAQYAAAAAAECDVKYKHVIDSRFNTLHGGDGCYGEVEMNGGPPNSREVHHRHHPHNHQFMQSHHSYYHHNNTQPNPLPPLYHHSPHHLHQAQQQHNHDYYYQHQHNHYNKSRHHMMHSYQRPPPLMGPPLMGRGYNAVQSNSTQMDRSIANRRTTSTQQLQSVNGAYPNRVNIQQHFRQPQIQPGALSGQSNDRYFEGINLDSSVANGDLLEVSCQRVERESIDINQARVEPTIVQPTLLQPTQAQPSNAASKLFQLLPPHLKQMGGKYNWRLTEECCQVTGQDAKEVGFKSDYSPSEMTALYGIRGILRMKIPVHSKENSKINKKPGKKKSNQITVFNESGVVIEREVLCDYNCQSPFCFICLKVARVHYSNVSKGISLRGILVYQKLDEHGNPVEHDEGGHNMFPYEEQQMNLRKGGSKFTECGLSIAQKTEVRFVGEAIKEPKRGRVLASSMLRKAKDGQMRCSEYQLKNPAQFAKKIDEYVDACIRSGDYTFTELWNTDNMTGMQFNQILVLLTTPFKDRNDNPATNCPSFSRDNPYIHTPDFLECLWPFLKVTNHDHDGSKWTFISLEFNDYGFLIKNALEAWCDRQLQYEIDFFRFPSDGLQVGHIGTSTLNHNYYASGMIICHSENKDTAGKLLNRGLEMLDEHGGDCNNVLVDGGVALASTINEISDARAKKGFNQFGKKNCWSHFTRGGGDRGGGKRGAKGSLPRYLLEQKVKKETVRKILSICFMISWIPNSDEESYKTAITLLLEKFPNDLNEHVRTKYLTGKRIDLGGHTCCRPGEVASTNGMERVGGNIKSEYTNVIKNIRGGSKNESRNNAYHAMIAIGRHKAYLASGDKLVVPTGPNKEMGEVNHAYTLLKQMATFTPASSLPRDSTTVRRNFSANFIYSFMYGYNDDDSTFEMTVRDAFGDAAFAKCKRIVWIIPTASAQLTSLSSILHSKCDYSLAAPFQLLRGNLNANSAILPDQLDDVQALLNHQSSCSPDIQKELKKMLRLQLEKDTPERKQGEDAVDYLYRRAHCPPSIDAMDTSHKKQLGSKRKGRGGGKVGSKKGKAKIEDLSVQDQREEILRREKEDVKVDSDHHVDEDNKEEIEIGNNGTDDNVSDIVKENKWCEEVETYRKMKRIIVNKELGDFTRTTFHNTGEVTCTCGVYSLWRWCDHCVFVDVLRNQQYPTSASNTKASDNWIGIRNNVMVNLREEHIDDMS